MDFKSTSIGSQRIMANKAILMKCMFLTPSNDSFSICQSLTSYPDFILLVVFQLMGGGRGSLLNPSP